MTRLFVKDAGELSNNTDGLSSHFIMLLLSPVILQHFVFPYLPTLFNDIASPSSAATLANKI